MSALADLIAVSHGIFLLSLIITPLVLLFSRQRRRWLERLMIIVGAPTILSFLVTGGCFLTDWEKSLRQEAGEPTYSGGFVRHYLGQVGVNWPDIATTIILGALLTLGFARLIWLRLKPDRHSSKNGE